MNINGINKNRAAITEFNGLKIRNNAGNSEFVDMENIDSHEYPYFSTRRKNYYLNKSAYGIGNQNVTDDMHGWCAYDTDFYYAIKRGDNFQIEKLAKNGTVTVVINASTMQSKSAIANNPNWKLFNRIMVVMGGDIVIYPDWIKYNTQNGTVKSLYKSFSITTDPIIISHHSTELYSIAMVTEEGNVYAKTQSDIDAAKNYAYAVSTSRSDGYFSNNSAKNWAESNNKYYFTFTGTENQKEGSISRYFTSSSMWMNEDNYVGITLPYYVLGYSSMTELNTALSEMDFAYNKDLDVTLKMSGAASVYGGKLNGDVLLHKIKKISDDSIMLILKGINLWNYNFDVYDTVFEAMVYGVKQNECAYGSNFWTILGELKIENELYNSFDYIVSEGNRLFACSNNKHEIYASKLGDPSMWKEFKGISTDSYAATVGSPGNFTGAAVFNNTPIFFKENCIHRVTGNTPASFNISYDYYDGIKEGCSNSIVRVGNYLIYYSKGGFVYYTGSQPERIDRQLGDKRFKNIFAGEKEGHYIANVIDQETNKNYFLDYDMDLNQWYKHQDNNPRTFRIINVSNDLYTFHKELCDDEIQHTFIECIGRNLNESQTATLEDDFHWYAESGWLIKEGTNKKYITKMLFKMHLDPDAEISISFKYDYNAEWEEVRTISNTDDYPKTEIVSIIPQRCETMQYKVEGKGKVIIYSITYDISEGSEL